MSHVPCCPLSVPCGLCESSAGTPCRNDCTAAHNCQCGEFGDRCCDLHYAGGAA